LPSTQKYLLEQLQKEILKAPVAVIAYEQSSGIGSRDNAWQGGEGNFFASLAIPLEDLPSDLPLSSASIYFSFIMKKTLEDLGENVWLKWPNDFYIGDEKVGGTITKKMKNMLVCGIGINLKKSQNGYSALQCDINPKYLLDKYLKSLCKFPKWKQVFSQYKIEFELSKSYFTHQNGLKVEMKDAMLCSDGSLMIEGEKVYSLR
jgi:BirA family biotin operon repressor/biotin-[acetyl-CoA-carboxylase] ligase